MGQASSGRLDNNDFRLKMSSGAVPPPSSIDYQGVFNENWFLTDEEVKKETKSDPSIGKTESLLRPTGGFASFIPTEELAENDTAASESKEYKGKMAQFAVCFLPSPLDGRPRTLRLNLVVVLDISGSMGDTMLPPTKEEDLYLPTKFQIATKSITALIGQLREGDRFGFVTFNEKGTVVRELKDIADLDAGAFQATLNKLHPGGGTRLVSGVEEANKMISTIRSESTTSDGLDLKFAEEETRIIVMTDMCDSSEDSKGPDAMFALCQQNSKVGIFATFIGVGVDFNSEVATKINEVKGANYMCVFDEEEFINTLSSNFSANFFPFAFDVQLLISVGSDDVSGLEYEIGSVYGTPWAKTASKPMIERWSPKTHCLFPAHFKSVVWTLVMAQHKRVIPTLPMDVFEHLLSFISPQTCCGVELNTCFPSPVKEGHAYGGPIVIQWKKTNDTPTVFPQKLSLKFRITFKDRTGRKHAQDVIKSATITSPQEFYDNAAIKKAALLQRYTHNIKQFLLAHEKDSRRAGKELDQLKKFSSIFTTESNKLADSKLIKDAVDLDEFCKRNGLVPQGQGECLVQ